MAHTNRIIAVGTVVLFLLTGIWSISLYRSSITNYRQTTDQCLTQASERELKMRITSLGEKHSAGYTPYSDTSTFITKTITTADTIVTVRINKNDPNALPKIWQFAYKDFLPLNVSHLDILFRRSMLEHSLNIKDSYIEYIDLKKDSVLASDVPKVKSLGYTESDVVVLDILNTVGVKAYVNIPLFPVLRPFITQLIVLILLTLAEMGCLVWLFLDLARRHKEKLRLIGFIKKMAYNIKRPLFASTIKISDLSEQMTLNNWLTVAESTDQVAVELNRISFYVDEVLAIIHSEEHPAIFAKERLPLLAVFESLKERYERNARKKVSIKICADKNDFLYINKVHFMNIMDALISNSIKYSNDPVNIELRVLNVEQMTTVVVRDDGWGIPDDDSERVFHKFYRVKSHEERLKGNVGYGLGLSYVKTVVRAMGGEVFAEKIEPAGTEMIMIFSNNPHEDEISPYFEKLGKVRAFKSLKDMHNYFSMVFSTYNWKMVDLKVEPQESYDDPCDPSALRIYAVSKDPNKKSPLPFFVFDYYYDVRVLGLDQDALVFSFVKEKDPYQAEHHNFRYAVMMQQWFQTDRIIE